VGTKPRGVGSSPAASGRAETDGDTPISIKKAWCLAADPAGWGKFGRPDWGHLKAGYGYVGESNSGTLTALLLCSIGLNKTSELTVADVGPANRCGRAIETFEGAKVHSGKTSSWLLGPVP
jgi:Ca-activated chloride channel family protein